MLLSLSVIMLSTLSSSSITSRTQCKSTKLKKQCFANFHRCLSHEARGRKRGQKTFIFCIAVLFKGASISRKQQSYSEDDLRDVIDLMRRSTGESASTMDAILVSAIAPRQECLNFCQRRRKEFWSWRMTSANDNNYNQLLFRKSWKKKKFQTKRKRLEQSLNRNKTCLMRFVYFLLNSFSSSV